MDSLLTETSIIIHEIKQDLLNYENSQDRERDVACSNVINSKFQRLSEICDRLDILVNKEQAQTRAQSRVRVNGIKYDIKHYQVRSIEILYQRKSNKIHFQLLYNSRQGKKSIFNLLISNNKDFLSEDEKTFLCTHSHIYICVIES